MDLWRRPRHVQWIVQHLDHRDQVLRDLPVESGGVSVVALSRMGGSADVVLDEHDQAEVDWFRDRFSIAYDPGVPGLDPIPWGVYLPATPVLDHDGVRYSRSVELTTKVAIIDQDAVTESWSLPANSLIIPAVVDLIESTGETRIAVTESTARTSSTLAFEAGTSKLTIINELLTSANYTSLWADGLGQFRVEPYIDPADRPLAHHFEYGEASLIVPGWTREQDVLSVPNRVIVTSPGDDESDAIVGIAENIDPASPYSIPSRGRVIARAEEVSDMTSTSAATAHARRLLQAGMTPVSTVTVSHAILPLEPHDLVRFTTDQGTSLATVREMSMSFEFEAQCSAKWREL